MTVQGTSCGISFIQSDRITADRQRGRRAERCSTLVNQHRTLVHQLCSVLVPSCVVWSIWRPSTPARHVSACPCSQQTESVRQLTTPETDTAEPSWCFPSPRASTHPPLSYLPGPDTITAAPHHNYVTSRHHTAQLTTQSCTDPDPVTDPEGGQSGHGPLGGPWPDWPLSNCKLTSLTSFFCCYHHNNKRRLQCSTVFLWLTPTFLQLAPRVRAVVHALIFYLSIVFSCKFAVSVGHPRTKMLSASGGFAPLTL